MDWKRVALGTVTYTAVTFQLAVIWRSGQATAC